MAVADRTPRLAIVSAFPALRAGLRALLSGEGFTVLAEASSVELLVADRVLRDADAVVVDPAPSDVDLLIERAAELPGLRALVLGPISQPARLGEAMAGRAWGYVPRDAGPGLLAEAARAVSEGLVAVAPSLAASLNGSASRASVDDPAAEELTSRERQVLSLVAAGLANKQIAQKLTISEHTVKFHVAAILAKLGAQSRTEAGYLAARRGLIAL